MFSEDNLFHKMPIYHIISMFEEEITNNFEEMVLLKGNLRIFASLNLHIRLFIYFRRHDCVMNKAGL